MSLLLTSVGVVALGRAVISATARTPSYLPVGRVARRLRRLLWLSLALKAGAGALMSVLGASLTPPFAALALLGGAGLTLLEFALMFRWLYPHERTQRGLQASLGDYLQGRLRLVWDALAPILAGGLGALTVSYTLSGQYRGWGGLGILTASAMGLSALLIGLGMMRRPTPLPIRWVPVETHLLNEAHRLGRELGVRVQEILVLDGTRLRRANAFALSGGRIAVTDYLLATLTEREVFAVLAHEVAHLAQRRRLVRLWLMQLGAGVGGAVALAPLWERLPRWGLLAWLGLLTLGMTLPLLRARQRHEREADAFAVSQYGKEPLASALRKIAALHQRGADEQGDAVHPSLQNRLRAIERLI
ncbi:MAG: M48 family metalloprotease [Fimbriimonadales bacterium]|nr:M48 family metalloprotease [Fimbriimonadales bacterium]